MKRGLAWFVARSRSCGCRRGIGRQKGSRAADPGGAIEWVDVPDAPPGVQVANVTSDVTKGAYAAFVKLPAGMMHPLHTHTNEAKAVLISGTFSVTPEGGVEKRLGPGSYFSIPGGQKHLSGCLAGAPCVIFQTGTAKFDMKPVPEKPGAKAAAPAAAPAAACRCSGGARRPACRPQEVALEVCGAASGTAWRPRPGLDAKASGRAFVDSVPCTDTVASSAPRRAAEPVAQDLPISCSEYRMVHLDITLDAAEIRAVDQALIVSLAVEL